MYLSSMLETQLLGGSLMLLGFFLVAVILYHFEEYL